MLSGRGYKYLRTTFDNITFTYGDDTANISINSE